MQRLKKIRVIQDSISKVIYLDWDENHKHFVDYQNHRNEETKFHYEDHMNTSSRINEVLPFIGNKKTLDFGSGQECFIKELGNIVDI